MTTFPVTVALGWTNALSWTTGTNPSNSKMLLIACYQQSPSYPLQHHRHPLPHPYAHRRQRIPPLGALQLVRCREQQSRAAHAERVTERDRAAVRVHPRIVVREAQLPHTGQ